MSLICRMTLPLPPSTNHIYLRTRSGGLMLAPIVQAYRDAVSLECRKLDQFIDRPPAFQLAIWAYVPAGRKRDADNMLKSVADALALALGIDDADIHQWYIVKRPAPPKTKGYCYVELSAMGDEWVRSNSPEIPESC